VDLLVASEEYLLPELQRQVENVLITKLSLEVCPTRTHPMKMADACLLDVFEPVACQHELQRTPSFNEKLSLSTHPLPRAASTSSF
jgi:hypothetical protein